MKKSRLTTWEAACIITGYGIGGGVLSLPYLAEKTGLLWSFAILIAALLASYLLHLMIADLALKVSEGGQIIACLSQFLFRGKLKKVPDDAFFRPDDVDPLYQSGGLHHRVERDHRGLLPVPGAVATLLFMSPQHLSCSSG
jgi:hypothetical protein